MVGPIYIIAVALGVAFLLGFFKRAGHNTTWPIMLVALAGMTFISLQWLWALFVNGHPAQHVYTSGFRPPFSINLLMGRYEAALTLMVNLLGLLGGLYLSDKFRKQGLNSMIVYLVLIMSLNVVIMTRDIFNLFVFLEVASIATAGLILLEKNILSLSAGFKYMIATGIIAGLLLIGIIFSYQIAGSLNLDDLYTSNLSVFKAGGVAVFLILISAIFELKPFPANGWGLDVYEGAPAGFSAIISSGIATAGLYILYKLLPLGGDTWHPAIVVIGLVTFVGSNLLGLNQTNAKRLLGYSSVGQIGLITAVIGFSPVLGGKFGFIAFTLLISHYLAKAGLFWLAGLLNKSGIDTWGILKTKKALVVMMAIFIMALLGLPPFPSFFGKWELIMQLSANRSFGWIIVILAGSLFEAVYLFRWFGIAVKGEEKENQVYTPVLKLIPIIAFGIILLAAGYFTMEHLYPGRVASMLPLALIIILLVIDFIPARIKNAAVMALLGIYAYDYVYLELLKSGDLVKLVFGVIFIGGSLVLLIPGFNFKGKRWGFYPSVFIMFAGLAGLLEAKDTLQFFFAWELMTLGSYFLILRGRNARKPAFIYIIISMIGAYFLLAAFGLGYLSTGSLTPGMLQTFTHFAWWIVALLALGFMVKMAITGFHLWLPGAYAEADDDATPLLSAVLINTGIFGFLVFFASSSPVLDRLPFDIPYILGWLGAVTAIIGNMKAVFQEDVKKLVAYSSIGVMGYILFAIAVMSNLGWLSAITYAMVHFMYKALIFLAIAGVIYRTGTRKIYEMGGLIKKMPWSFIAVLIGIITLAGMPPLAGFAGKWMLYNVVVIKGWIIQGALVFFAGIVAFLYCFKLIHNIFLGPIKDNHRRIRETTIWWLLPQFVLIGLIMVFSVRPGIFLEPVGNWLSGVMPGESLRWDGTTAYTSVGFWDATKIMYVVGGMFAVLFGILFFLSRKVQKVGMFDMVFQAERPTRPETHHYAYNMFAHYNKALGFMVTPWITRAWHRTGELVHDTGNHIRQIYSGNAQSYALHIVIYFVIAYFLISGGF